MLPHQDDSEKQGRECAELVCVGGQRGEYFQVGNVGARFRDNQGRGRGPKMTSRSLEPVLHPSLCLGGGSLSQPHPGLHNHM